MIQVVVHCRNSSHIVAVIVIVVGSGSSSRSGRSHEDELIRHPGSVPSID